jgi:hypothetical protein
VGAGEPDVRLGLGGGLGHRGGMLVPGLVAQVLFRLGAYRRGIEDGR